ncbi:hypothetical protein AC249_AIPGENE13305 [Exaiptasia diaphana]|nr:hypothetical protein AC249_AIPGENE13305 [Exaiptasia diaphana]
MENIVSIGSSDDCSDDCSDSDDGSLERKPFTRIKQELDRDESSVLSKDIQEIINILSSPEGSPVKRPKPCETFKSQARCSLFGSSCLRWTSYKLCPHSLAVAEKEGTLKRFTTTYCKSKDRAANFTSLATQDMPKGHKGVNRAKWLTFTLHLHWGMSFPAKGI